MASGHKIFQSLPLSGSVIDHLVCWMLSARFRMCDPIFEPYSDALLVGVDGRKLGPATGQGCKPSQGCKVIRSVFKSQPDSTLRRCDAEKLTQPP